MDSLSASLFALLLAALWCGFGVYGLARMAARSPQGREMLARLRRSGPLGEAATLAMLVAVVAIGGTKPGDGGGGGGGGGLRSAPPAPPPEPAFWLVEVRTEGVALRAEPTNSVEAAAWRLRGASEDGFWIECERPFFALGTNPVRRVYASASGALSFESAQHPPIGAPLPDSAARSESSPHLETTLPQRLGGDASPHLEAALVPFRAPLGLLPAAVETNAAPSRFWHAPAPGGGLLVSWENVLVDRLPGRRATVQAELRPNGDFTYRYDFADALDPPATNFVIGAQAGTNAVNALYFGPLPEGAPGGAGWGSLSAPVWRVNGGASPQGEPQSIADLLCTNGALRTPARFALEWRNTSGLDPNADSDGDGLPDWDEVFRHGTAPRRADTDGDGISDSAEVLAGANPLDADENHDGIPDGADPAAWAADPLWAANATNDSTSITITLNAAIPADASASLVVGDLCIPLRSPGSWTLALVPGELYAYRLHTSGAEADLSIAPATNAPPQRSGPSPFPFWTDGSGGVFGGPSDGGAGSMAIPVLNVQWVDPGNGSHSDSTGDACLHGGTEAVFTPMIQPTAIRGGWLLSNLQERNGKLVLSCPSPGVVSYGSATLFTDKIRFGVVHAALSAHRCDSSYASPYCSSCGHYQPDDLTLSVRSTLTLKHDNQTTVRLSHPNSGGTAITGSTVEIRRKSGHGTAWQSLGPEASLDPWTAKIAGTFELRGRGTADGREVVTPVAEVEVRFPSYSEIVGDTNVVAFTDGAWASTLADCSPGRRRERGFWIYLDTTTDSYESGPDQFGDWADDDEDVEIRLHRRPSDIPSSPLPTAPGARYPVASFHTHTPTAYRTNIVFRYVGPSDEDNDADFIDQVPGVVYDYTGDPSFPSMILGGHPLNAPAQRYQSLGVERRPTP